MIKVGLTGNIAAGKTEVKKLFEKHGVKTICADSIVHELLENNEELFYNISKDFCDVDIFSENKIDRKKLGKIVFSNEDKKKKLEGLIHPLVIKEINHFYNKNYDEKILIVDIPLLFEGKFEYLFDRILLVYASDDIRFERIKKRNNFEDEYIKKIMNSQFSQEEKKKKADFIIVNENKTLDNLEKEVIKLIEKIK